MIGIALAVAVVVTAVTAGGNQRAGSGRRQHGIGDLCRPESDGDVPVPNILQRCLCRQSDNHDNKHHKASATTTTGPVQTGSWWVAPLGDEPWQWEIDHALSVSSPSDMGVNAALPNGSPAPNPVIYDIDGFDNPASTVSALHTLGPRRLLHRGRRLGNYYAASAEGQSRPRTTHS